MCHDNNELALTQSLESRSDSATKYDGRGFMRSKISTALVGLAATLMIAFSSVASATNGYFTHGVGAESKAMAGTGIGSNAQMGPIIAASNPALAVFAKDDVVDIV